MKKIIIANAQGIVEENLTKEQRVLNHSKFTPTGIFVVKGSKITIKLLENDESLLSVFIGQWGSYKNLNDGQSLKPKEYVINEENQTIISEIDGMLYLYNKNEYTDYDVLITAESEIESEIEDSTFVASKIINEEYNEILNNNINSRFAKIVVEDPIEVPTFVVVPTTNEEFQQMLYDNIESPFVEIIGEHVFGTFQMELAKELWIDEDPNNYNINETFTRLDRVYELTSMVSGLNLEYNGIARKVNNKIHIITNPDTGAGYASATHYHIIIQQATGAGKALFKKKPNEGWYIWHEIGHTFQNPRYKWNDLTEVTVNISALWVEREFGFQNNLIKLHADKDIKEFILNSNADKNFDKQSLFVKLGMFWQLDQAFGKWFYSTLNQSCRLLDYKLLPTDNELKKQFFIQMTSKIANRNLIPFFAKWGIKADEDTEKIVSKYPKLTKEIWNNIFDGHYDDNAIVEHELRSYQPVQEVKVISFLEKSIGDEILKNEVKENIMMEDNLEVESVEDISYQKPDFLDKKSIDTNFVVIDRNEDFVGNKYQIPAKLNFANSILLEGMG